MKKLLIAIILATVLAVAFSVPAFAAEGGEQGANPNFGQFVKDFAQQEGPLGQEVKVMAQEADGKGLSDEVQEVKDSLDWPPKD